MIALRKKFVHGFDMVRRVHCPFNIGFAGEAITLATVCKVFLLAAGAYMAVAAPVDACFPAAFAKGSPGHNGLRALIRADPPALPEPRHQVCRSLMVELCLAEIAHAAIQAASGLLHHDYRSFDIQKKINLAIDLDL